MREVVHPKRALAPLLVSRIKVMAKLDIAEKRIPQDGRIPLRIGGREVDVRVSTLPTGNGERAVLRLLDKQAGALQLPNLGMDHETLTRLRGVVASPHGIFLVTGPTGSGKTTTLYAAMGELDSGAINILTIEKPDRVQHCGDRPDAGQREGGHDVCEGLARHPAPRPRRRHGGRDPRPRNRPDGRASKPHRSPGDVHGAHQYGDRGGHAVGGHGGRAVSHCVEHGGRAVATPGSHAMHLVQGRRQAECLGTAIPRRVRPQRADLSGARLRWLPSFGV